MAEELQSKTRGEVLALIGAAALLEQCQRAEGVVEAPGAQVPAWSGPETNSQNGSKS